MTVVAKGDDGLMALISETTRAVMLEALKDHVQVMEESLSHATTTEEHERLGHRLAVMREMQSQIEGTTGQVHLTGPEDIVAPVIKTATSNATHELDILVEDVTRTSEVLAVEERERLRAAAGVATTCVETLIACEGSRRGAGRI